jgi:hypothetical protein
MDILERAKAFKDQINNMVVTETKKALDKRYWFSKTNYCTITTLENEMETVFAYAINVYDKRNKRPLVRLARNSITASKALIDKIEEDYKEGKINHRTYFSEVAIG